MLSGTAFIPAATMSCAYSGGGLGVTGIGGGASTCTTGSAGVTDVARVGAASTAAATTKPLTSAFRPNPDTIPRYGRSLGIRWEEPVGSLTGLLTVLVRDSPVVVSTP